MRTGSVGAVLLAMFCSGCAITPAMQEVIAQRERERLEAPGARERQEAARQRQAAELLQQQQEAARRELEAQQDAARRHLAMMEAARPACTRYGFKDGTDGFAHCLQMEVTGMKIQQAIEHAQRAIEYEVWLVRSRID
jgi:hypothetical protein